MTSLIKTDVDSAPLHLVVGRNYLILIPQYGFEKCNFEDGECDLCGASSKLMYWKRSSYEYNEGDYFCEQCTKSNIDSYEDYCVALDAELNPPNREVEPPPSGGRI